MSGFGAEAPFAPQAQPFKAHSSRIMRNIKNALTKSANNKRKADSKGTCEKFCTRYRKQTIRRFWFAKERMRFLQRTGTRFARFRGFHENRLRSFAQLNRQFICVHVMLSWSVRLWVSYGFSFGIADLTYRRALLFILCFVVSVGFLLRLRRNGGAAPARFALPCKGCSPLTSARG